MSLYSPCRSLAVAVLFVLLGYSATLAQGLPRNVTIVSVTGPHLANGQDQATVTIYVRDRAGRPVSGVPIYVEVGQGAINPRVGDLLLHLKATSLGAGVYTTSFASPLPGTFLVAANAPETHETGFATVIFVPVAPALPSATTRLTAGQQLELPIEPLEDDTAKKCAAFFDDFDNSLNDRILDQIRRELEKKVADGTATDEDKRRLDEIKNILQAIKDTKPLGHLLIDRNAKMANIQRLERKVNDGTASEDEKRKLDELKRTLRELKEKITNKKKEVAKSIKLLSDLQIALFRKHFEEGGQIKFDRIQTCMELFDNFKLTDEKNFFDKIRLVVRGPDSPLAYMVWPKYAECIIEGGFQPPLPPETVNFWRQMFKILVKGFFIVMRTGFTGEEDEATGEIKPPPKMLTDQQVADLRAQIDNLNENQLKDKLIDATEEAKDLKLLMAQRQIEMMPGHSLLATIEGSTNPGGEGLVSEVNQLVHLAQEGTGLFGYGVDAGGRAYALVGEVNGEQVSFTITGLAAMAGYGVATFSKSPATLYEGTIEPGRITGTFEGKESGLLGGVEGEFEWRGVFTLENLADVDKNGIVNRTDVEFVASKLGTKAGDMHFDQRADITRDGRVDLMDLAMVAQNVGRNLGPVGG